LFFIFVFWGEVNFIGLTLGEKKKTLSFTHAQQLYLTMAREVFWKPSGEGAVASYTQTAYHGYKLLSAGEKYSHATLARVLEEYTGADVMIDAAVDCPGIPRVVAVSTIASHSPVKPYLFRSFAHRPGRESRYEGSAQFRTWEALRASTGGWACVKTWTAPRIAQQHSHTRIIFFFLFLFLFPSFFFSPSLFIHPRTAAQPRRPFSWTCRSTACG
jgi:hypothetical protein